MDDRMFEVMKKYEKGNYVDPEDMVILDRLASVGLAKYGYSIEKGKATASLSNRGRRELAREKIYRNPIKRFFYKWYVYLGI